MGVTHLAKVDLIAFPAFVQQERIIQIGFLGGRIRLREIGLIIDSVNTKVNRILSDLFGCSFPTRPSKHCYEIEGPH